jgi:hypothetical protein
MSFTTRNDGARMLPLSTFRSRLNRLLIAAGAVAVACAATVSGATAEAAEPGWAGIGSGPGAVTASTASAANSIGDFFILADTEVSGRAIQVPGDVSSWGQALQVSPYTGGRRQTWQMIPAGPVREAGLPARSSASGMEGRTRPSEGYKIVNSGGLCVDAWGATPTVGAVIQQYGCDPSSVDQPNQLWYVYADGSGEYLVNGSSFVNPRPGAGGVRSLQTNSGTSVIEVVSSEGASWPALVMELGGDGRLVLGEGSTAKPAQRFAPVSTAKLARNYGSPDIFSAVLTPEGVRPGPGEPGWYGASSSRYYQRTFTIQMSGSFGCPVRPCFAHVSLLAFAPDGTVMDSWPTLDAAGIYKGSITFGAYYGSLLRLNPKRFRYVLGDFTDGTGGAIAGTLQRAAASGTPG